MKMVALQFQESSLITMGHSLGYSDRVIQLVLKANMFDVSFEHELLSLTNNNLYLLCPLLFRICARFLEEKCDLLSKRTVQDLKIEELLNTALMPLLSKQVIKAPPNKYGQMQQIAETLEILKQAASDFKAHPTKQSRRN